MKSNLEFLAIAMIAATLTFASTPAFAQGNGKGRQQARGSVETQRAGSDIYSAPSASPDRASRPRGNGSGKIPPGWCQGVGNPHRTVENCGYSRDAVRGDYPNSARNESYDEAHLRFHRDLDDRYGRLAAERPLDIRYQLDLQARKRAEHEAWHRRMGVSH